MSVEGIRDVLENEWLKPPWRSKQGAKAGSVR